MVPGAVLSLMAGSVVGGLIFSIFGQAAVDTAGPFVGTFAFVGAAAVIAPSSRSKVALAGVGLVALVAVVSFVLAEFTTAEPFVVLSPRW